VQVCGVLPLQPIAPFWQAPQAPAPLQYGVLPEHVDEEDW
jgi:hypothetical protein